MNRREFLVGAAALAVAGVPKLSAKPWQIDFMRTMPREAACLPTLPWWDATPIADPRPLTVERLHDAWRASLMPTVTLSRAEVEKLWPSRPEV